MTAARKRKTKSTRTAEQKANTAEWLIGLIMALPESLDNELASDWLERKMIITEGPFPGPYTFARSPYLREIVDNLSVRSDTIETVLIKANQIGASMCSFGVMAYYIDKGIGPQLFVSGDATMAEEAFSKRLDPIIESAGLRHKIRAVVKKEKATSSATGDTKSVKSYGGTFIRAVGPNSEGKLRSFPSQINYIEELDVFPQLLKGKGNPIEKIVRRADSFGPLRRIYYNSTPKEKTTSQILPLMEAGDWRKYMWHCPKCGKQQAFEFSGFHWEKTESGSPKIDIDERGRVTNDPVWYECQNEECKHKIVNGDKYKLLLDYKSGGTAEWVPTKKPERPGIRSYQLNAFYGFRSWLDIILQYERVKDDPILYPDFVNDVLAECSEAKIATPEPHVLMARRENWKSTDGHIPAGVSFLVLSCDVQADRLEASLVGIGQNVQSWVLNYWTMPGDTADLANVCWENLASKIEAEYTRIDGVIMRPVVSFIDAGFRSDTVRAFCSQYSYTPGVIDGVYPVFGRDDYVAKGRNYKIMPADTGAPEVVINDQHFKRLVYSYIEREADYKRGYIHFPSDLGEDYFKGLTAEDMIETTTPTGKTVYKIMNTKKRRNEPLDLQKMAYAALYFMTGEYYKAINKRRVASKKTEIPPDLDEFIRVMTPESDFYGEDGE